MGRIKSTLIKRSSRQLLAKSEESFTKDFEHNKKALGTTLPSKRMRNKIAGYIARIKKNTKTITGSDSDTNTNNDNAENGKTKQ